MAYLANASIIATDGAVDGWTLVEVLNGTLNTSASVLDPLGDLSMPYIFLPV